MIERQVGRTALATGASRGLGRAMAERLGSLGVHVLVHYHTNGEGADNVVASIIASGGTAQTLQADLRSSAGARDLADRALRIGPVDMLINNAGTVPRPASWDELTDETIEEAFALHLTAPLLPIQRLAPPMLERSFGRIVNLTSTCAFQGAAAVIAYTTAKAGVSSMTMAFAAQLTSKGVTVNAIAPGSFDTDMTAGAGEAVLEWALASTPAGRLGTPSEVADAMEYLINASFVSGTTLIVDGGQLLKI